MVYRMEIFLFCLLSSFIPLHGMEPIQRSSSEVLLISNLKGKAEELIKQMDEEELQEDIDPSFCNCPYKIACDDDLNKAFSNNYNNFAIALDTIKEEKENGIFYLAQLACQGDIPSKYLLYSYYKNKDLLRLNLPNQFALQNKTREWLIDAVESNYPPACFDHGLNLLNECNIIRGLPLIEAAANGGFIKFPYSQQIFCYHYLPAVTFLAKYYNEWYSDSYKVRQLKALENFLKQAIKKNDFSTFTKV